MIVALQFAPNNAYTQVVPFESSKYPDIKIMGMDYPENGKIKNFWEHKGKTYEFGQARRYEDGHKVSYGVIMIFDSNDMKQLSDAFYASRCATEQECFSDD